MLAGYSYVRMGRHFVRRTEMEVTIKLREATLGDILPKYEWQVVALSPFDPEWVVDRSEDRAVCVDYLAHRAGDHGDYTLRRVAVYSRPRLTDAAKRALELIVGEHGRHEKIRCIKDVRTIFRVGLKEAKELVEDYLAL
jgi:hypothetical protein